ncbi:MAG: hypothetical protein K0R49_517 [Burkholderiales bacterium]|nr:hypothetical protein [Burkholderiales bacterium]
MDTIKQLDIKYNIIRWDEWLLSDDYKIARKQIEELYSSDIGFYSAVEKTALSFLDRFLNKNSVFELREDILYNSREYLKEEAAVMLIWAQYKYKFEVYPSPRNLALKYVHQNFIAKTNTNLVVETSVKFKTVAIKKPLLFENDFPEFENLISLLPNHVYFLDTNNIYRGCNLLQAKAFGFNNIREVIGKKNEDMPVFINNYSFAKMLDNNNLKIMNCGDSQPLEIEEEVPYLNGEMSIFKSYKVPLFNKAHQVIGLLGISYDITKYKKEMKTLQENYAVKELTLDNLLANLPGHVYWMDIKNKFLGCNDQQAYDFALKSRHEIVGLSAKFSQTPENAATIIRNNNKVMSNGEIITEEEKFKDKSGKDCIYLSKKAPLKNKHGEIVGLLGISLDITAQKERDRLLFENQLYKAEHRYGSLERILSVTPGHVYWKNLKGEYQGCNDLQAIDAGLKRKDDIVGLTDYDMPWKEDAGFLRKIDAQVVETGEIIVAEEKSETYDGRNAIWLSTKGPLRDEKGKIIGIVGISLDITAQKEAAQLKHENRKLEAENKLKQLILEKETAEAERLRLENALHKLENEKQKAILEEQEKFKKFVGQIVHDIKSPLASLKSIVSESGSAIPEGKRITLRRASMRISDIAQNMLSHYKNENDACDIAKPVLVSAALLEVLGEKRYEHKNIAFDTAFEEDVNFNFIQIEPGQFKRLLSNLLNNAVEALDNKPDGKIKIELSKDKEWVYIVIEDNGKGMPEKLVNKIEKNLQVTSTKKNGSGIGLTQVRETLERNDGQWTIYSYEGEGTRILLKFPRIFAPLWIAEKVKIINGDMVIILDDDHSIHGAWDLVLEPALAKLPQKPKIKHFSDGQEAVNFINSLTNKDKNKICLLTDYELLNQDINGLQVIEQTKIKRSILVTSHYANLDIQEQAAKLRIKILPKELALAVTINVDKKIKPGSKKVDMVCVDDDLGFVHGYIDRLFPNLAIDVYNDPDIFLEDVAQYPLDTKIVLDHYYSRNWGPNSEYIGDGIEVAIKLHSKGFTNLFMLTGEEPNPDIIPSYLSVILKDDDEKIKNIATP